MRNVKRAERALRRRMDLSARFRRSRHSIPAAVQITIAAMIAYLIARFGLGHPFPLVALIVTIIGLGFARDARPRRVLDTVVGMLIGISFAELMLLLVGSGVWQLAVVLTLTLLIARFVSSNAAFASAAGVQSILVMLLPPPEGGVFTRTLDGLVGAAVALAATALIPRDPRAVTRRSRTALLSVIDESMRGLVDALETADEPAADLALTRLRRTQQLLDEWQAAHDSAVAIARISPFLRRHLPELASESTLLTAMDLTVRHLRVIARRVDSLVRDGLSRPLLARLIDDVAASIRALPVSRDTASESLRQIAPRLDPQGFLPEASVTESVIVLLIRPLVVDLLVASGMPADEASDLLPDV